MPDRRASVQRHRTNAPTGGPDGWPRPLAGEDLRWSWEAAWQDLGAEPLAGLYERLLAAWNEPQRHYHCQQHLGECLALLERWRRAAEQPAEVAVALWFHDAVYDVRACDNEFRSAEWAAHAMQEAGCEWSAIQRVHQMIMATRHDGLASAGDQALLLDIDLAILGSPPQRFEAYDRAVRAEYSWVPESVYRGKRREVLEGFLRPDLYRTGAARALVAEQAAANVRRTIAELAGSGG